jgi:hypothetical protein
MTERWSGVFLELQRRRCRSEADLEGERQRFPQALGGQSPKMVFLLRVHVTRTSVVEMGSMHLGDALEEMLQGRRCPVPKGKGISDESHHQAKRRRPTWTRLDVILQA